jgi:hypothetical protein
MEQSARKSDPQCNLLSLSLMPKSCDYSRSKVLFGITLSPFDFDLLHPTHNMASNKSATKGRSHFLKNLPFNRNSERGKMHERDR